MAESFNCVFCYQHLDQKLILFSEATLKKCRTVLKYRKMHNLKYKLVELPLGLNQDGYHRNCYKSFTALMKKYYGPNCIAETRIRSKKIKCESLEMDPLNTDTEAFLISDNEQCLGRDLVSIESPNIEDSPVESKKKTEQSLSHNFDIQNPSISQENQKHSQNGICGYHEIVFDEICKFIKENTITNGQLFFLTYLHRYYMNMLKESASSEYVSDNFLPQHLENKIKIVFRKDVKFICMEKRKILVPIHLNHIDEQSYENLKNQDVINTAALLLRRSVINLNKFAQFKSVEDLKNGKVLMPTELNEFYCTLIASAQNQTSDPKFVHLITSHSEDIAYNILRNYKK